MSYEMFIVKDEVVHLEARLHTILDFVRAGVFFFIH